MALIIDLSSEQTRLVLKLSLMPYLCHVYFSHFADLGDNSSIPVAQPSTDGSEAARVTLFDNGNIVVIKHWTSNELSILVQTLQILLVVLEKFKACKNICLNSAQDRSVSTRGLLKWHLLRLTALSMEIIISVYRDILYFLFFSVHRYYYIERCKR